MDVRIIPCPCCRTVLIMRYAFILKAKKFVESVPKVLKENINKEEAEKLQKLLEELGAKVTLE
jgi:ribosomal protein L7/L12